MSEHVPLGELLSREPSYGANASAMPFNGVRPRYIRITDIDSSGRLIPTEAKSIPEAIAKPYLLSQDDIVIARTGNTVGKSYIHDESNGIAAYAGYLVKFEIDRDVADPHFIFQYLYSPFFQAWIAKTLRIGAQPNINASEYKTLPIPKIAPIEQTKIAEILSTVDRAIEQTEALIAKQQRIKTGLMQDLLTRGIDEQGNLRSEQTHPFKDSPLGRIPVEWECGNVLAFASRKRQPILTGPFGSSLGTDDFVDHGVPVLRIGNVQAGFMELSDLNYVTEECDGPRLADTGIFSLGC